ncbi:thioesterase II family protein [Streptomyces sp. NPDC051362]|uniref:thioesterase II family protein n=1 Tax=Streptomyces sp. NPDC051362 TaxID=3365651 RepID=UPI0037A43E91
MRESIQRFHAGPEAETQLVCFPHAGGAASAYHPLSTLLGPAVETLAVQYPGRQDRHNDPWIFEIPRLVDQVVADLERWMVPGKKLALFGHSMGAVLAFEAARRLERSGRRLAGIFLSGRQAPTAPRPPQENPTLYSMDDTAMIREMRLLSGTPHEVLDDPDLVRLVLPILRADYKMLAAYTYEVGSKLECPIVALTGDSDPWVEIPGVRRWEDETSGPFDLHVFPGGHFYLQDQLPHVVHIISQAVLASSVRL